MWYHPAAFAVGTRDVIAAWIVCLTLCVALFAFPEGKDVDGAAGAAAAGLSHRPYTMASLLSADCRVPGTLYPLSGARAPRPRLAEIAVTAGMSCCAGPGG